MRGFAAIGLDHPKTPENVGSALRASQCYGAAMLAVAGKRFKRASTDTFKTWRHMPVLEVDDLKLVVPYDCVPVAVDLIPGAQDLTDYKHPERAFYIFGPEDGTLGEGILSWCRDVVYVPTNRCMNLAATVNVVLYDRAAKMKTPNVEVTGAARLYRAASVLTAGLCRDDVPRETILEIAKRHTPLLLEFFVKEKELCTMLERQHVRKLCDFHSFAKAKPWTYGYFCVLATREACNDVAANNDLAILKSGTADFCANFIGVCPYIKRGKFPIVFDSDSGFGIELLALINNGLNNQLWWKGYPCRIQC